MHWFGRGCRLAWATSRSLLVPVSLVAVGAVGLGGCRSGASNVELEIFTPPEGRITFQVSTSTEKEGIMGVDVSAVTTEGIVPLGETDAGGRLIVDLELLKELEPYVVVFCRDYFFCGAIRSDSPDFFGYRMHAISLAVFTVD